MDRKPDLSAAEFEIMSILWSKGHATVKEIKAALAPDRTLSYSAISTLLTRMREKGYVEAQEKKFAYEFHPLVKKELVIRRKLGDLVERILGGDVSPLAAYIAENRKLTQTQIETLEEIAREAGKGDRDE